MIKERSCPVCSSPSYQAKPFFEGNVDLSRISEFSFSSRKIPEFMSHRLVQCRNCDLVYVDTPPAVEELAEAYHRAEYDSSEEAEDAARAYASAIAPFLHQLTQRQSALEIGTGTGIFLDHLATSGFRNIVGIEPSRAAIDTAPQERRNLIREGIFIESEFERESFDLICCFMTMEHVHDPGELARAAFRLLRKGGAFMTVTHDYRGLVNRILGKHSPIIDIEHMQLFSSQSIKELFHLSGFEKIAVTSFVNSYSLRYWLRLSPLPDIFKNRLSHVFELPLLRNRRLSINVGNTLTVGFRGQ